MPNDGWEGVKRKTKGRGMPQEKMPNGAVGAPGSKQLLYHEFSSYHWI